MKELKLVFRRLTAANDKGVIKTRQSICDEDFSKNS